MAVDPTDALQTAPAPAGAAPSGDAGSHLDERNRLTVLTGLAALALDAMASVAYGPEAIVLVLATAGAAGLDLTLPVTAAIAALLVVLTVSYRQVIAAFPDGGGSYGVAKAHLGRSAALVAAASLIVDYVLNVAVSIAAGVAALTSAAPGLHPYTVWLCLGVLVLVTAVNLRGVAFGARVFMLPTALFVGAIFTVVVVGLLRDGPAAPPLAEPVDTGSLQTVGLLLVLKAFANGCASLTGVEAIANAVPSFRAPSVVRAQRAEVLLGVLLGTMLLGIAVLIERFDIRPAEGVTVLSQVTNASLGDGFAFYVVQVLTVVLLALAANTSFGGMPVLAQLLARDHRLPHVFALRAHGQVYRFGIAFLAVTSAILLVAVGGRMNTLVPLFAIGVFIGFTLAQAGMVRHWREARPPGWQGRVAINGLGAALTGIAAIVVTATKLTEGGWLIAVALPLLVLFFARVERAYGRIASRLEIGHVPPRPHASPSLVIVPVGDIHRLTTDALDAALSLGDRVVAVHVTHPGDEAATARLVAAWARWSPGVPLEVLHNDQRRITDPIVDYVRAAVEPRVFVLIPEIEPAHLWERILQNQRGAVLAHTLRRDTEAVICRLRFRVEDRPRPSHPADVPAPATAPGEEGPALGEGRFPPGAEL